MAAPQIATTAQVRDYLGLTSVQMAANIPGGGTLSDFIQRLLDETASLIVDWIGYDRTFSLTQYRVIKKEEFYTVPWSLSYVPIFPPVATPLTLTGYNYATPDIAPVNIGVANIYKDNSKLLRGIWWDMTFKNSYDEYILSYQTPSGFGTYNGIYAGGSSAGQGWGWTIEFTQCHVEMVAIKYRQSSISLGSLGLDSIIESPEQKAVVKQVGLDWKSRLRPYKLVAI